MNIAVLTLPLHTNYGGILQAYALQTVLERMGHQVTLLEPKICHHHTLLMPLVYTKRFILRHIGKQQYTERFIRHHIHRKFVRHWNTNLANQYDAIIVGSDQIWRPQYVKQFHLTLDQVFLDFAKNSRAKCIAYAVSFGTSQKEYSPEQVEEGQRLLKNFKAISVREVSGVQLCKDYFQIDAQHVLDPTLLLSASDYALLSNGKRRHQRTGDMLVYILDENETTKNAVERIAKEKGLTPFIANSKVEQHNAPLKERIQPPVELWLQGFRDAKFVVTDSFHACVFAILHRKPFVILPNEQRGSSRIDSLLQMLEIDKRSVTWHGGHPLNEEMDWETISLALKHHQEESMQFLQQTLSQRDHTQ